MILWSCYSLSQFCGSVYAIYGSGSSTLTIYGSGSRRANNIRIQVDPDPDPNAGIFVTQKVVIDFLKKFQFFHIFLLLRNELLY